MSQKQAKSKVIAQNITKHLKIAIIGSGPAGYTAAIYSARAQRSPTVFTGLESGGQLMYTSELENFPGFTEGINGVKFMMTLRAQAERFGAQIQDQLITAVDFASQPFKLWTSLPSGADSELFKRGSSEDLGELIQQVKTQPADYLADSIIIATGATAITLGVPGEKDFFGKGVSVCAVCDAPFYRDKDVFVIGGGDCAMEDALALTKFAKKVNLVHRRTQFKASKIMQDRVLNHPKIKVWWESQLKAIRGQQMVESIVLEVAGKEQVLPAEGVFLAIGHRPVTELFANQLLFDAKKYLVTSQSLTKQSLDLSKTRLAKQERLDYPTMTSVPGVFAAGDVVDSRYQQAITAAAMGCQASLDVESWLEQKN